MSVVNSGIVIFKQKHLLDCPLNDQESLFLKRICLKVFFKYVDVPKLSSFRSSTPVEDETSSVFSDHLRSRNEESKLGFNMCECGFEGISIKVAKRSSNQLEDDVLEEQVHLSDSNLDIYVQDQKVLVGILSFTVNCSKNQETLQKRFSNEIKSTSVWNLKNSRIR